MDVTAELLIDLRCELGEGPIWHPERRTLIFFDILRHALFEAQADGSELAAYGFGDCVSVAGWIDAARVLVAGAQGFEILNLDDGSREPYAKPSWDVATIRSNDGRVAPDGALWIGSMGRRATEGSGALHRLSGGALETLIDGITIPNATCFSPDGRAAYFTDTPGRTVWRAAIDPTSGKPQGWATFLDVTAEGLNPDGAVVDSEGGVWIAFWGSGRVSRFTPDGRLDHSVLVDAPNTSCPAFGGPDLKTLYVTTAREHMTPDEIAAQPLSGGVFAARVDVAGQRERRFVA